MKLTINDQHKIFIIQEEFNNLFPYLALGFFSKSNHVAGPPQKKSLKYNTKTMGEFRTIHNSGDIIIIDSMTVAELEQCFANIYGLGVQVFRKSGKSWLETTVTDNWTLKEQNKQGEELSRWV